MNEASIRYRRALGAFPTGVTVVTAEDAEGPLGLTVNSFTSVSLDPPLVLWCLDDACDRRHVFHSSPRFAINVLASGAEAHARHFARGAGRVDDRDVERGRTGAPLLRGAAARFECEVRERIQMGDHQIIVGEVLAWDDAGSEGLAFSRGRYGRVAPGEGA